MRGCNDPRVVHALARGKRMCVGVLMHVQLVLGERMCMGMMIYVKRVHSHVVSTYAWE